ncbi:MAG: tRNA pseudouridine(55) synthase TruB [Clostridia bacterium]|nr:tRNA pseudouridine(55) synthase TruB [Clostridia bacterium]
MNGFYNVIKPIGWTSSDLVVKIRGILRKRTGNKVKIGHLGTLDPLATGVLGVAVGSATKLFDHFLTKRKTYIATCVLGKSTDTLDSAGQVTEVAPVPILSDDDLREALSRFRGEISQIPPLYSAKSVDGTRAYRLASKGVEIVLKPCTVTIYSIELLSRESNDAFRFLVECSGGTYIRSLCRDLGMALGLPAYMSALERTRNGMMRVEDAVTLERIEADISDGFVTLETFGKTLETADFSEEYRFKFDNGVKQPSSLPNGLVRVIVGGGFYGIGQVADGEIRMIARDL